jgi:hypothetical protein
MTSRKRAPVRRRAPSHRTKKGRTRIPAYRTHAPELLANVRQRYEETPEPVPLLAADLGILPTSFYRLARDKGWVRRNDLPARDVAPAMKILEAAKALESGAVKTSPDASAQLALLAEGGERVGPAPPAPPDTPALSTVERLERAVLAELATIEAMRAAMGTLPQKPPGAARTVRTLSMLTQTLQHLQRLRASAALSEKQRPRSDHDSDPDDDMPADLDEFRRDLARRIDAFVESRTDAASDRGTAEAAAVAET